MKARTGGKKGRQPSVTMACPEAGKYKCEKKNADKQGENTGCVHRKPIGLVSIASVACNR